MPRSISPAPFWLMRDTTLEGPVETTSVRAWTTPSSKQHDEIPVDATSVEQRLSFGAKLGGGGGGGGFPEWPTGMLSSSHVVRLDPPLASLAPASSPSSSPEETLASPCQTPGLRMNVLCRLLET